jgi:hypothetical protein
MPTRPACLRHARVALAGPLAWVVLYASACLATSSSAGDDGSPGESTWKLQKGISVFDTVDATRGQAYDATVAVLHREGWTIADSRTDSSRIVTDWKPLRHLLVRLVPGEVLARCVVRLAPIGPTRIALSLEGKLATSSGIGSSTIGLARHTYEAKSRDFLKNVAKELASRRGIATESDQ